MKRLSILHDSSKVLLTLFLLLIVGNSFQGSGGSEPWLFIL